MANTFKVKTNDAMPSSAGTPLTLYTVPSATTCVVIGLTMCNVHSTSVTASVKIESDTSDTETNQTVFVIKDVSIQCEPEEMNAEDPLFILYTSGSTGLP